MVAVRTKPRPPEQPRPGLRFGRRGNGRVGPGEETCMNSSIEPRDGYDMDESVRSVAPQPSLWTATRRRWPIVVLATVAAFMGAAWYAERLPAAYSAQAIVAVTLRPGAAAAGPETVSLAAAKYVAYLQSSRAATDGPPT